MPVPIVALLLALCGGAFCRATSAFLGVSTVADGTMIAAETCRRLAGIVIYLGWFIAGCISEIRTA